MRSIPFLAFFTMQDASQMAGEAAVLYSEVLERYCKMNGLWDKKAGAVTVYQLDSKLMYVLKEVSLCECGDKRCPANKLQEEIREMLSRAEGQKIYILNDRVDKHLFPIMKKLVEYLNDDIDFMCAKHLLSVQFDPITEVDIKRAKQYK